MAISKQKFLGLVSPDRDDGRRIIQTTESEVLLDHLKCVVRIQRKLPGKRTQYFTGGVLLAVEPDFLAFASQILPGTTFSMKRHGCTFYILTKAPSEVQAWTSFANSTFGPDTIEVTKLP